MKKIISKSAVFLALGILLPMISFANVEPQISCSAISPAYVGENVTWTANNVPEGYGYTWNDNSGNPVSVADDTAMINSYTTTGTKTVTLTVGNGEEPNQTINCSTNIIEKTIIDNGGDTGGDSNVSSGRRSSSRVITVEETATSTSTDQVDIDNLVAWLRNNPDLFSTLPQEIVALNLENPIASTTLATNDNGTSSTSIVASSTESENNLAAAAATASGSAAKYAWYIAGIILLGLIGWLAFFLLKRRNKKDKIS